jgi:hypothetical protein
LKKRNYWIDGERANIEMGCLDWKRLAVGLQPELAVGDQYKPIGITGAEKLKTSSSFNAFPRGTRAMAVLTDGTSIV